MVDDAAAVPGVPAEDTIQSVIAQLQERGFTTDMFVTPDALVRCAACDHLAAPADLELDELRRVEGDSDPADMAAVLALTCLACGSKGTAIVRFGPEAEPQDVTVLRAVDDERF
jgi:hypothetical protein